ncbi:hypothetical protein VN97_g245 [Penicillium thymicola]|uniref:Uncharacterized protein n=1 Tax=Penicillium thymicola TaxID=293382 RepID=A0AAI9TU36_PENTH|nr:hypothetical protein VN97_g245 [Penicillium thymicola]
MVPVPEPLQWYAAIVGAITGTVELGKTLKRKLSEGRRRRRGRDEGDGESGAGGTELQTLDPQVGEINLGQNVDEWGLEKGMLELALTFPSLHLTSLFESDLNGDYVWTIR